MRPKKNIGGMEYTPEARARMDAAMEGQEVRWARKAGPLQVRKIGDPKPEPIYKRPKYTGD